MKLSCGPLIFFKDFVGVLIHNAKIPLMYLQVLQLGIISHFLLYIGTTGDTVEMGTVD
jgi:hypothetical protein